MNLPVDVFICAAASDSHFYVEPIAMSCGHYLCKGCVPNCLKDKVVCKICKHENKTNLNDMEVSVPAKLLFGLYCKDLLSIIKSNFEISIKDFKEFRDKEFSKTMHNFDEMIKSINERIDFLKRELDNVRESMRNQLENIKKLFLKEIKDTNVISADKYEDKLKALAKEIDTKDTFSMELNFRTYQSAYQNLTILLKKIDSAFSKHQINFVLSKKNIDSSFIGAFQLNNEDFKTISISDLTKD